jgi:hypothetical protein
MNLICYICEKEISVESKIAKVILAQLKETNESINYINNQEEMYIHFDCLKNGSLHIVNCQANIENFNQSDFRIINKETEIFELVKKENLDLIRNNILNF